MKIRAVFGIYLLLATAAYGQADGITLHVLDYVDQFLAGSDSLQTAMDMAEQTREGW